MVVNPTPLRDGKRDVPGPGDVDIENPFATGYDMSFLSAAPGKEPVSGIVVWRPHNSQPSLRTSDPVESPWSQDG
jgi:hypothetical protein